MVTVLRNDPLNVGNVITCGYSFPFLVITLKKYKAIVLYIIDNANMLIAKDCFVFFNKNRIYALLQNLIEKEEKIKKEEKAIRVEAVKEKTAKMVKKMLSKGIDIKDIMDISGLTKEQIEKLQK